MDIRPAEKGLLIGKPTKNVLPAAEKNSSRKSVQQPFRELATAKKAKETLSEALLRRSSL